MPANGRNPSTYSWTNHRTRRNRMVREAIGTMCPGDHVNGQPWRSPNCDRIMTNPRRMHLAHTIPVALGGTTGDRVNCAPCNLGAGAILGNQLRAGTRHTNSRRATRTW